MAITFSDLVIYFMLYSFLGWICEVIYCSIPAKKFVNRGFFAGPYCPIYGFGALIILFLLHPFMDNPLVLFVFAVLSTTLIEYVTSWAMEALFGIRWWDYSSKKFNLNGRICVQNSLIFGVMGVGFTYFIHPLASRLVMGISSEYKQVIAALLFVAIVIDLITTLNTLLKINEKLEELKTLLKTAEKYNAEYTWLEKRDLKGSLLRLEEICTKTGDNLLLEASRKIRRLPVRKKPVSRLHTAFPNMKHRTFEQPLSLLIFDTDGSELTNSAFTYMIGDLSIRRIAGLKIGDCYARELIFRRGGDELVALHSNVDSDRAKAVRNKSSQSVSHDNSESTCGSVALCCSTFGEFDNDILSVLEQAESDMYRDHFISCNRMYYDTIELIVETINARYQQERIHTERVANFCRLIGTALKLTDLEIKGLETAGALHDVGKMTIPLEILCKPERLTIDEYDIVKRHPETGYQFLRVVDGLAVYAEAVLSHHERWDGGGYPQGLQGEEIPLFSRIITVADAFEAMTANRVYRNAFSTETAVNELLLNAGKQFDPNIVEVFIGVLKENNVF